MNDPAFAAKITKNVTPPESTGKKTSLWQSHIDWMRKNLGKWCKAQAGSGDNLDALRHRCSQACYNPIKRGGHSLQIKMDRPNDCFYFRAVTKDKATNLTPTQRKAER